jgi:hypothetical protein
MMSLDDAECAKLTAGMSAITVAAPREPARGEDAHQARGTVLLAGEFCETPPEDVILALHGLASRCTTLTLAVVAEPPATLAVFLPFSGVVCFAQMQRDLEREACMRACALARLAPPTLRVEHLAMPGWSELERHVRRRGYDTVIVGELPRRLRDRRRVRRAGWTVEPLEVTRHRAAA